MTLFGARFSFSLKKKKKVALQKGGGALDFEWSALNMALRWDWTWRWTWRRNVIMRRWRCFDMTINNDDRVTSGTWSFDGDLDRSLLFLSDPSIDRRFRTIPPRSFLLFLASIYRSHSSVSPIRLRYGFRSLDFHEVRQPGHNCNRPQPRPNSQSEIEKFYFRNPFSSRSRFRSLVTFFASTAFPFLRRRYCSMDRVVQR